MPPADTHELIIEFDEPGRAALAASRSRLVLVKLSSGWMPDIVWVACDPQPVTRISWEDVYGMYGGGIPSQNGDPAAADFDVYPASDRTIYHFFGLGFGTPEPAPELGAGRFAVVNHTPFQYAFGLTQRVTVNGAARASPVNWTVVPGGRDAQFTRSATISMWTQPDAKPGQLITTLPASRLTLAFDDGQPVRRYRFDADAGALGEAKPFA